MRVGHVDGEVVGYNIGNFGRFNGATFPLVIETEFGAVKAASTRSPGPETGLRHLRALRWLQDCCRTVSAPGLRSNRPALRPHR